MYTPTRIYHTAGHADAGGRQPISQTATQDWSMDPMSAAVHLPSPSSQSVRRDTETLSGPEPPPLVRDQTDMHSIIPPVIRQRFHNLRFVGRGGMGTVFSALDIELAREVAIKFVHDDTSSCFLFEARAQARVMHENVCKIYDIGVADGQPFITMQLVRGQPLHLAREHMTLAEQVKVVRVCAAALHEVHCLGLVHRDVKPGNILVERDEDGQWKPYVMDFGLARVADESGVVVIGALAGTPAYMAPEQARGDARALDRRADIYSLGATLYDILTGRPPYIEGHPRRIDHGRVQVAPPRPRSLLPGIPVDLDVIVMRCLELDPSRRYDSARALGEDLQRYLDGEPIHARPTSCAYRLARRVRRHKLVTALVASLAIAVAVLAGVTRHAHDLVAREAELVRSLGADVEEMRLFLATPHAGECEPDGVRARIGELAVTARSSRAAGPLHAANGRGHLARQAGERALLPRPRAR
jgi:hypothetical protein